MNPDDPPRPSDRLPAARSQMDDAWWPVYGPGVILLGIAGTVVLAVILIGAILSVTSRRVEFVVVNRSPQAIDQVSIWDGDDGVELGPIGPKSRYARQVSTRLLDQVGVRVFLANTGEGIRSTTCDFGDGFRCGTITLEYDGTPVRLVPVDDPILNGDASRRNK